MTLDYKSAHSDVALDETFQNLINACSDSASSGIDITINGELHVWGLSWIWKPGFTLDVDNVPCPINTARIRDL